MQTFFSQSKGRNTDDEDDELTTDLELKKKIQKGEDLLTRRVRHLDKNNVEKAYDKYCRGLQCLFEVVPKLTTTTANEKETMV